MTPRAVVVAHREAMVAEGIAAALRQYPGIIPVAVATTAAEGERRSERADAVALDAALPGAERAARRLRGRGIRVVFLGEGESEDEGIRVSTRSPVSCLVSALAPGLATEPSTTARLTPREKEILALVARGLAAKQVARHLGISAKTVERHKTKIFAKLGVPNQTAAVSLALSNGLGRSHAWNLSSI
jgi:DNA-binding NarL/FixJ family response regulator